MTEPTRSNLGNTTYTLTYEDFASLREAVEASWEEVNHIESWTFWRPEDLDPEGESDQKFSLYVVMPRKDYASTEYTTVVFDRAEVDAWLAEYVRPRVLRWYGYAGRGRPMFDSWQETP